MGVLVYLRGVLVAPLVATLGVNPGCKQGLNANNLNLFSLAGRYAESPYLYGSNGNHSNFLIHP